jgi:hypothetical protein
LPDPLPRARHGLREVVRPRRRHGAAEKLEPLGVEHGSVDAQPTPEELTLPIAARVERIAENRVAEMPQVDAHLMGATGLRHGGDEGAAGQALEHHETCRRRATVRANALRLPPEPHAGERSVDTMLIPRGVAVDQRNVAAHGRM